MSDPVVQPNATIQVTDPQVITAPLNIPVSFSRLAQNAGMATSAEVAALQNQIAALDARVTALESAQATVSGGSA